MARRHGHLPGQRAQLRAASDKSIGSLLPLPTRQSRRPAAGWTDVALHTNDDEALFRLPPRVERQLRPADQVRLRYLRGYWGRVGWSLRANYLKIWPLVLILRCSPRSEYWEAFNRPPRAFGWAACC